MNLYTPREINISALPSVALLDAASLPPCPAIYFVLDAATQVQYVGQAASLMKRWKAHHRLLDFVRIVDGRIAWLVLPEGKMLSTLEAACIDYFRPPLNHTRKRVNDDVAIESLTVRFPQGMLDTLRISAKDNDRSLNAEIVHRTRVYLAAERPRRAAVATP